MPRTTFDRIFRTFEPKPFVLFRYDRTSKVGYTACYPYQVETECAGLTGEVDRLPAESSEEFRQRCLALRKRAEDWLANIKGQMLWVHWRDIEYRQPGGWADLSHDTNHASRLLAEYDPDTERLTIRFARINDPYHTYHILNVQGDAVELNVTRADMSPDREHFCGVLAVAGFRVVDVQARRGDFQHDLELVALYMLGTHHEVLGEWSGSK